MPVPFNPRKTFFPVELDELASSIKQKGIVQPLIVRPAPDGNGYELVAGETALAGGATSRRPSSAHVLFANLVIRKFWNWRSSKMFNAPISTPLKKPLAIAIC